MTTPGLSAGTMGTLIALAERYEGWNVCVYVIGPLGPKRTRTACIKLARYGLTEVKRRRLNPSENPGSPYALVVRVTDLGRDVAAAYRARTPTITQQAAK